MNPWRPSVVSGVQRDVRQCIDDLRRQMQGVDQNVLSLTGMGRDALDVTVALSAENVS